MRIVLEGRTRPLPQSRKTRGLLAWLALVDRRHRREELCELLWEAPGDPRAALRWSLSKLRPLLLSGGNTALVSDRDSVTLDRDLLSIDVVEIRALVADRLKETGDRELLEQDKRFSDSPLAGLDDLGSRRYQLWLESERKSIAELQGTIIGELLSRESLSPAMRLELAARRVALDPLHETSNVEYLRLVLDQAGLREAQETLQRIRDHYGDEGQADSGLLAAWHRMTRLKVTASGRTGATPPEAIEVDLPVLPEKPSLAVLDFTDLGSKPDATVLARGLAVDLNARLAQLPSLFVIARQSAARIDAARLAPREVGRRLGIRYLINGSVQRQNKRVRTTVTLTEATAERELWSEHFDRPLDDIFEVQDDITNAVIAAIEPAIERAEMQRALMKPPESLNAWEHFHRGLWHCFRFTAKDNEIAHRLFRRAVVMDPQFARAWAGISFTHYSRAFLNSAPDVDGEIRAALDTGRTSIGFDGRDAMGHWSLGRALFLSRQHDEALISIDNALAVNPNYAHGHYARGFVGIHSALDDESLSSIDTAERLSPYDPLLFAMKSSRAISLANQGRYAEAAAWSIRGTQEPNAHFHIYAVAAACLELAGRSADAKDNARWVLGRRPDYSVEVFRRSFPHKDEASREPLLAALARAGIPRL